MKNVLRAIALLMLASLTFAYDSTINWQPPTQYTNGNQLLEQDLDYYTFYCDGVARQQMDSIIGTWSRVVDIPEEDGDHLCWITVTTLNGAESAPSNTKLFTNGTRVPNPPTVQW